MPISEQALVAALSGKGDWVDAGYLADTFGVTTRTVRTYVKKANEAHEKPIIESSYRGYRLVERSREPQLGAPKAATTAADATPPHESRTDALLRRLISASGPISVYDLADELCVSDSTIEAELRHVRDAIRLFDLTLVRSRDTVTLDGGERDKRRLIGQMLSSEGPSSFASFTGNGIVSEGYDIASLSKLVSQALEVQGLHADDYGLNNVVLHVIVMTDRIRSGRSMPADDGLSRARDTPGYVAARTICSRVANKYNIEVDDAEVGYLSLVVSSNSSQGTYSFAREADLQEYLDDSDIELTQRAIARLEDAYYLEPFDSEFVTRMAIHVHSLRQRIPNGLSARNPLTNRIKQAYPLIYDMAVFVANELSSLTGLTFNEDEIAFIAFHLGASLEHDGADRDRATVAFLYMGYHDLHRASLERVRTTLANDITLTKVASMRDVNLGALECDIVITPLKVEVPHASKVIVVNPIITDADMESIRQAVNAVCARKRGTQAYSMIQRFLVRDLFRRNFYTSDETTMIRTLATECSRRGLCPDGYAEEVLEREAMSSTAFGNRVAIPHSMSASCASSFLSVVVNERPVDWGGQKVNVIMLMGISKSDRKAFRVLFDNLLQILAEPANVSRLIRSANYDDFSDRLNEMIMAQ